MIAGKPKVLVGQIFHEGNSFNARLTGEVDFVIYRGADIMANCAGNGSTLGGILDALNPADVQIIPSIAACASPGGPVEQGVWENLWDELLTSVRQAMPDLILLDLHGAMVATGSTDPEGELLLALRDVTGPDVLIGVGLDLHGHITDEMCEAANVSVLVDMHQDSWSEKFCGEGIPGWAAEVPEATAAFPEPIAPPFVLNVIRCGSIPAPSSPNGIIT